MTVAYTTQVSVRDGASVTEYGARSIGELPWCGRYDAQAVAEVTLARRAQPLEVFTARFVLGTAARALAVLGRDLSDRVTLWEDETFLDGVDFFVEAFDHTLTGDVDHVVTVGLEAAPVQVSPVFRLDTAGQGADQGRAGSGIDDPASLFILDSAVAGHRLDEGRAAA